MEFYSKAEADAAFMEKPDDPEVYAAFTRFYAREYPGEGADVALDNLFAEAQKPKKKG